MPTSACSGVIFRAGQFLDAATRAGFDVDPRRRAERSVVDGVEVGSAAGGAAAEGDRLFHVAGLSVAHRRETHRRQRAVGGRQVAGGFFLAHRQQPAAIDHHLGVERGQTVNEPPPVLFTRRRGLGNEPRVARLERALLIERRDANFMRLVEKQAAGGAGGLEVAVEIGHLTDLDVRGAGGKVGLGQYPFGPQQDDPRLVVGKETGVDAHSQQRLGYAGSSRQGRPQIVFQFRSADHAGPGQIEPAAGPDRGQLLVDAAVELGQLRSTPLQPHRPVGRLGKEGRSLGKALRALGRHDQLRIALELGDRHVVQSPVGAGQLGVAVGRQPHGQPGERSVSCIAFGQFPQHAQHRLLHARIEHVVVRRQSALRG